MIMEYRLEPLGNTLHLTLQGSMYVDDAAKLREDALASLERGACSRVEADLSRLDYIDSAGLGVLISLHKRCARKGGSLVVRGLSGNVKELFEITRMDKVFLQG